MSLGCLSIARRFSTTPWATSCCLISVTPDLRELGVGALGHRKMILRAVCADRQRERGGCRTREPRTATPADADVRGSCRLDAICRTTWSSKLYNEIIRAYQDTATQAIEAHGGYVAKYVGDGVPCLLSVIPNRMRTTPSAPSGLAQSLIEQVSQLDAGAPGRQLSVRIGIETGPCRRGRNHRRGKCTGARGGWQDSQSRRAVASDCRAEHCRGGAGLPQARWRRRNFPRAWRARS